MQNVSEKFLKAMASSPYRVRLTLDGVDTIPEDAAQNIDITGGSSAEDRGITLGGTVSGSAVLTLDKEKTSCKVEGRKLFIEFGLETQQDVEWLPIGTYTVTEAVEDDGILTVTANDALAAEFDVEYEALEGFDFSAEAGVDSLAFLTALCERRGVPVELSGLESVPLNVDPVGYTERQIIGFISALYGGFADIDRLGVLRIRWYSESGKTVDADSYYENAMEMASYDFTVGWLKCYVEPTGETLILGNTAADQGIYFECLWMSMEQMELIWQKVNGFTYRPVTGLELFGDPRLDAGDIVTLKDLTGEEHTVPLMGIVHEWDGGIITKILAKGLAKTDMYSGPTTQETNRKNKKLEYGQKAIWEEMGNVLAKKVMSILENSTLVIDGAALRLLTGENETVALTNQFDGAPILYMRNFDENGERTDAGELSPNHLKLGGTSLLPVFYVSAAGGVAKLWLNAEDSGKALSWKDNGDGTFTLIGQ